MERLKYIILLVFLALLSCNSASNFNKEVKTIDKINGFKKIKISNNFINFLKEDLKKTDEIYFKIKPNYQHSSFIGWDAIIFDSKNNLIFNLDYDENLKNIKINNIISDYEKEYFQYIFKLLDNHDCDSLIKAGQLNSDSQIIERVYKINLNNSRNIGCEYDEIFFFK